MSQQLQETISHEVQYYYLNETNEVQQTKITNLV